MAHQTSHRRALAAPHPHPTPMDPTAKRHPKPSPFTTTTTTAAAAPKNHHPIHPLPDPTTTAPPSTIQAISHRFSKLYTHHKKLLPNSLKPQPNPQLSKPSILDSSCSTLTKSISQKERHHRTSNIHLKTKVKEKDDIKNPHPPSKTAQKRSSFVEFDVKKASQLMSKSLGSEGMKAFQDGMDGMRGRISLSSIPPPANGGGGRRRSFCSSQVELGDFLSSNGVKIVAVDMPPFMQIHAVDCARKAHDSLEKFTSKTLAFTLKKEFDGVYGPAWHCIVGTSFGSFVTHSVGGFIYFSMDHKLYVLLFKTTVQRAE